MSIEARMDRVRELQIDGTTIDAVDIRAASSENGQPVVALVDTPEICRVRFTVKPTAESNIGVELWMPTEGWNGAFVGTGNGGQAGAIAPTGLIEATSFGCAAANTDLGTLTDAIAMAGAFERIRDFGGRATHLMTAISKQIIAEFYGRDVEHSYFIGVSTGGQQALREALDYPDDYDGIVAMCPANNRVRLHTSFVWNWQALTDEGGAPVIPPDAAAAASWRLIEVYGQAAGAAPGDTFLPYPDLVEIDWAVLEGVLAPKQIAALRSVAEGPVDPVTKERIFGSYSLSADLGDWYTSETGRGGLLGLNFPFQWLWGDAFDPNTFDVHADRLEAQERLSELLDARSPDLRAFRDRGGKLILLTGTADPIIPYHDTIEYYDQVVDQMGGADAVAEFCRFFVVPGLGHGADGPGSQYVGGIGLASVPADAAHNVLLAVKQWVEQGTPPERIVAVRFAEGRLSADVESERPVFPWPTRTQYVAGDPARVESYGPRT